MENLGQFFEQFKVAANDLGAKIAELIHEGNVRRIIIRDDQGHTFMEIPLTVAAVGAVLAPILAAVGAIAALVTHVTVVVERTGAPSGGGTASGPGAGPTDPSVGAREDQTNMAGGTPPHGENDASGG